MNLKEAFRYQNFLEAMLKNATNIVTLKDICLDTVKRHLKHAANPEAEDVTETVDRSGYLSNDDVIAFMVWLVDEREKLTTAICEAKKSLSFDLDAAIEANKFRQQTAASIRQMLTCKAGKSIEGGRDFRFNNEGNQVAYMYNVEVETKYAYNYEKAKQIMRDLITTADKTSVKIDSAMINTSVAYKPRFDVNETFEDIMQEFKTPEA